MFVDDFEFEISLVTFKIKILSAFNVTVLSIVKYFESSSSDNDDASK